MFQSRLMLSGLLYVLQALVGVSVWSLTQRLVHSLVLRLHTLSSGGRGGVGQVTSGHCSISLCLWVRNFLKAAIVLARLVETAQCCCSRVSA
ncbi:unnamed protein product [Brassica rapa subsp. narinosa]